MAAPPESPHILLITNDQHRFDFVEGGPVEGLRTPGLMRLRREGTTLTQAFSSCPLCVPTRFTWWYGVRASQANGAWGGADGEWPRLPYSLPGQLRNAGYQTAVIGKIHSHSGLHRMDLTDHRDVIHDRGFDHVFEVAGTMLQYHDCDYTHYLEEHGLLDTLRGRLTSLGGHHTEPLPFDGAHAADALIGRKAREWLQQVDTREPFFLHASFCDPHFPYDPPADFAARFALEDMPVPEAITDPEDIAKHQRICARYCAMIEHCDREIGRLLDVLEARGLSDQTLVVFSTDHGDMMGSRGVYGKSKPYDPSARTPITVRYPGTVPAGREIDTPVESIDLPATLLEAAGLDPADALPETPSRSWWPCVTGHPAEPRRFAYSEMGIWKMVVDPDWKFIHRSDGEDELYHRAQDPAETRNLAAEPDQQPRIREMQRWIIEAMSQNIAPPSTLLNTAS